jgi:hypothetical protein
MRLSLLLPIAAYTASADDPACVAPGTCVEPDQTEYPHVAGRVHATPRKQWGDSGGFCGALSIQAISLSYGVWHSQDLIRKVRHNES